MRTASLMLAGLLAACSGPDAARQKAAAAKQDQPHLTNGEERTRIVSKDEAAVTLRSGPQVPVALPRGFTLVPGATVMSNTTVERDGARRMLLIFETREPLETVMRHYRAQAQVAGASLALDLGGDDRASIGGELASGGKLAISARRAGGVTRVKFAAS